MAKKQAKKPTKKAVTKKVQSKAAPKLAASKPAAVKVAKSKPAAKSGAPSMLIDKRIKELADWRGDTLAHVRSLIKKTVPNVIEEWKWRGVPVWEHGGIICTGETYKSVVKLTFMKGAQLKDPSKLFNSSLEGNARRAIDFHEGEKINEAAFQSLISEAVSLNTGKKA